MLCNGRHFSFVVYDSGHVTDTAGHCILLRARAWMFFIATTVRRRILPWAN